MCMSNATTLWHTMTCQKMLHQIITKLLKHSSVFNLIMNTQELTPHKSGSRRWYSSTILIVVKVLSSPPLIFYKHFVQDYNISYYMVYQIVSLSQVIQGPPTMANLYWRTPIALSTSFLAASCAHVKWFFLLSWHHLHECRLVFEEHYIDDDSRHHFINGCHILSRLRECCPCLHLSKLNQSSITF